MNTRRWLFAGLALALLGFLALPVSGRAQSTRAPAAPKAPAAPRPPQAPTAEDHEVWFGDVGDGPGADWLADLDDDPAGSLGDDEGAGLGPLGGSMSIEAMGMGGMGAGGMRMRMMRGAGMRAELMDALKLTDAQKDKLADLRDHERREAIQARADIQLAALDLARLMRTERPDRSAIDAQIDKIAERRASLRKTQIATMFDMRDVLTAQQRDLLKQKRAELREQIRTRVREGAGNAGARREVIRERRAGRGGSPDTQ
jgi:Spy/CpxP family protein refolding chaperone